MKKKFIQFAKDESGATLLEYLFLLAIVAIIAVFAFPSLRQAVVDWITGAFRNTGDAITNSGNKYICPDGKQVTDLNQC